MCARGNRTNEFLGHTTSFDNFGYNRIKNNKPTILPHHAPKCPLSLIFTLIVFFKHTTNSRQKPFGIDIEIRNKIHKPF